jgi:molybdopterin-guanine dinucleotide biosynthesis protein A
MSAAPYDAAPVWACVLIGGRSSRMGRPKHLIQDQNGVTWLERTVHILRPFVAGVVLAGRGEVPESLADLVRIADVPGIAGPLAGILAAMRRRPGVSWLLAACDMPDIKEEAVRWLLARRRPTIWGTVPRLREEGPVEPLLAYYDPRCRALFEDLLRTGCMRIGMVAADAHIETPIVPEHLREAWRNVNTPADLCVER